MISSELLSSQLPETFKYQKVFVAGHRGLVGAAIVRALSAMPEIEIVTATKAQLDLRDGLAVDAFLTEQQPDLVILAAAKVGGIHANNEYPAEFIADNLAIQHAVIDGAYRAGVSKLVFLGSSCIYPKFAPQPMPESCLLTGPLEPTNEWYAVAKIAGIKMCQAYRRQYGFDAISLMPTNLYGPQDNFDLQNSHVLPALMRKFHEAKQAEQTQVEIWGTGTPRREFLHVDDLAAAVLFLAEHYSAEDIVNVGVGEDVSIAELAGLVADAVGYTGDTVYNRDMPDGTPRKLLDVTRLHGLGWQANIALQDGIASTYAWFQEHEQALRK